MSDIEFNSASEVRKHLKAKGVKTEVKIRWGNNPFGGKGKFFVNLKTTPAGASVIHASSSAPDGVNGVFSDNKDVAKTYGELSEALKGTNAKVA